MPRRAPSLTRLRPGALRAAVPEAVFRRAGAAARRADSGAPLDRASLARLKKALIRASLTERQDHRSGAYAAAKKKAALWIAAATRRNQGDDAMTSSTQWTITWLGHGSFRIETGGALLLVDPWLKGNPSFDDAQYDAAIAGATHILVTHGHGDHVSEVADVAAATGAAVVGIYDLISWLAPSIDAAKAVGMNKGGTVALTSAVSVTMVNAVHSSSLQPGDTPIYLGAEAGFMIRSGAETLYFAGDTDVMADMALFQELHAPRYAILPIGGHFTMDAERAAFAVKKFFSFDAVIPGHYRTFPVLAQSADAFKALAAPTRVIAPDVMAPVTL